VSGIETEGARSRPCCETGRGGAGLLVAARGRRSLSCSRNVGRGPGGRASDPGRVGFRNDGRDARLHVVLPCVTRRRLGASRPRAQRFCSTYAPSCVDGFIPSLSSGSTRDAALVSTRLDFYAAGEE